MNESIKKIMTLVILGFSIMSCNYSTIPQNNSSNDVLVPLKVGNYWEYSNSSGKDFSVNYEIILKFITENDDSIYGKLAYGPLVEVGGYSLIYNSDSGYYNGGEVRTILHDTLLTKILLAKYPVNVGDEWETNTISSDSLDKYKCISKSKFVVTPAGTFNCIVYKKYNTEFDEYEYRYYYTPGVGLILTELYEEKSTGLVLLRSEKLIGYKIN